MNTFYGGISEWAQYYVGFVRQFFINIWMFIKAIALAFWAWLVTDVRDYIYTLVESTTQFTVWDWLAFLLVLILNVSFIVFITMRIIQHIRRKKRFSMKSVEKEELLEEIETLNSKIEELVLEKNQILGMKVTGGRQQGPYDINNNINIENKGGEKKQASDSGSRFVKLISVDEKYEFEVGAVNMQPDDCVDLSGLCERFMNFAASQLHLYYEKNIIAAYFAGMATSKIMILEGISGTGKTSLPYAMGKFFDNETAICSVQPSWRDRQELLGYLNEFTKKFNETDFLKALYETTYREDLNFIVLDEMNLARIEYYFAEFLSIMEMPDSSEWKIDLVPESLPTDPKNLIEGKLLVPQNVWFIGTANRDDSTFTITDKVYDRATILEMNQRAKLIDAPYTPGIKMSFEYLDQLFQTAQREHALSTKSIDTIMKIDAYIFQNLKVTFGNRIMKQLKLFVPVFVACGRTETEGIDYFVCHKVLRKFESLNLSFVHKELEDLISLLDKLYGKGQCTECIDYIRDLIKNS